MCSDAMEFVFDLLPFSITVKPALWILTISMQNISGTHDFRCWQNQQAWVSYYENNRWSLASEVLGDLLMMIVVAYFRKSSFFRNKTEPRHRNWQVW
jgi:hypothetical protein